MKALTCLPHVPTPSAAVVREHIARALQRSAVRSGRHIDVEVGGYTVTLRGRVATWLQRETAEAAALEVPGVAAVDNRLDVGWPR
jgi:osmotically-inducible protein OsmY